MLTAIAPALLKNIANPFGNTIRKMVEKTEVITVEVLQISTENRISLKLKAVEIPQNAVTKTTQNK
jgi:predicted RNA-binding protein with RPS1 domain